VEVIDSLYIPADQNSLGLTTFDPAKLQFKYSYFDREANLKDNTTSARDRRSKYLKTKIVSIYPDTTVWAKEMAGSYTNPMVDQYFWHEAYGEYPVVEIGRASCRERS